LELTFHQLDAPEVEVRELITAVALGPDRLLEPADRLVGSAKIDQVYADVVVRIAVVGIDRDRLLALLNGFFQTAEVAHRPAEKGVRLGCRVEFDGLFESLDRLFVGAGEMQLITLLPEPVGLAEMRRRFGLLGGERRYGDDGQEREPGRDSTEAHGGAHTRSDIVSIA
jgi:hypothetical protein